MEQNKMEENKTEQNMKKKKKIKVWIIILIVVVISLIILGVVLISKVSQMIAGIGTGVEVTEALKGNISQTVSTSGTVASEEVKTYFAQVSASIDSIHVQPGQEVKAGELLLAYDLQDLEKAMAQTELETKISTYGADAAIVGIDYAQQKAAEATVNYEDAKKYVAHYTECVGQVSSQLQAATELAGQQVTLEAEIKKLTKAVAADPTDEDLANALKTAEKEYKKVVKKLAGYDVKGLEAALSSCSADLAEYKALLKEYELGKEGDPAASLNKAQQAAMKESALMAKESVKEELDLAKEGVRADFDGIVSEVSAVEGQPAAAGTQLFTIHDRNSLKVTVSVTKYDVQKLAVGQSADIKINDKEYTGKVSSISRIAGVNASGTPVVNVDIHIDNPDETIILGMEAKITIQTAEETGILVIPSVCVNYSSDGVFCYVLVDGVIEKREIETGISDDEFIQVLSGLEEGDKVVTNVTGTIEEGMKATEMSATEEDAAETKDE